MDLFRSREIVGLAIDGKGKEDFAQVDLHQRIPLVQSTMERGEKRNTSIDSEGYFVRIVQLPQRMKMVTSTFIDTFCGGRFFTLSSKYTLLRFQS